MTETNQATEGEKRARTGQLSGVQITFAMVIAFGLILAINFSSRIAAGQPLMEMYQQVQADVEQLQIEQATLTAIRDYSQGDAYVEQWARSEGKMIRDGEVLVVAVPAGGVDTGAVPTPEAIPTIPVETTNPEPQNWVLWWQLFFDVPPPQ